MNHRNRATGGREFSFSPSPRDERIVFAAGGRGGSDLYLLGPGGSVTRLTDSDEYESDPCFSPDGKSIAYAVGSEDTGGDRIAVLDIATKQSRTITDDGGNDFSPVFSPDGKSVTYLHQSGHAWGVGFTGGWDSEAEIRRVRLDDPHSEAVGQMLGHFYWMTQSRDGKILAWDSPQGIWVAVGSQPPRRITDAGCESPSISPNDAMIAYDQRQGTSARAIYVAPISGGKPKKIVGDLPSIKPQFSSDGKWIYYLQDTNLWKVHPDGHDHSRAAPVDLFFR